MLNLTKKPFGIDNSKILFDYNFSNREKHEE